MLDMEDNAPEFIKQTMIWDLSMILMNDDDELQW